MFKIVLAVFVCLLVSRVATAHPGNTDKYGCHTNKKIGYYHCHTPKDASGKKVTKEQLDKIKAKKKEKQNNDK